MGLKNIIPNANLEEEFSFVFAEQRVNMKAVFAEFISPKVSKLHQSDPTINSINFTDQLNGITLTENILSKFKSLSIGESVDINNEEIFEMKILSILIENEDIFTKINNLHLYEIDESNIDQYLTNLTIFNRISPSFHHFDYQNIIDFISSHFYLIDSSKLKRLPKPIIYSIISNPNLKIHSEDSLFEFIEQLFECTEKKENDSEIIAFYEEIEFSQLSEEKFNEFVNAFNPSLMTHKLWTKLAGCFYMNIRKNQDSETTRTRYKDNTKKIEFNCDNTSNAMHGIIDYLTKKSGGNVSENGTVKVTSTGYYSDCIEKYVVDLENTSNYYECSTNTNAWLMYDFVERKVHPTQYSIRTRDSGDSNQLRNWAIEGSNTGSDDDWTILDNHQNDMNLKGLKTVKVFNIKQHEGSYRYLRIRQTGKNSSDNYVTQISALEYFGTLIEN